MTESSSRALKIFLCHSSGDKATVRELYRQLSAEEWIDPWLDEMKLLPGQEWDIEIEKAVEEADIVLVCLSTRSVDKEGYIQKELRFVLNIAEEKPEGSLFVIPLRLDDCIVPRRLKHWQWVDYFPESQKSFAYKRLLDSFKVRARKLGILSEKPKEQPAPKPAENISVKPSPVIIPEKQAIREAGIEGKHRKEKEATPQPVKPSKVVGEKTERSSPQKTIPWRLIASLAGGLTVLVLFIWGGMTIWNNLPTSTPEPTRTLLLTATMTPSTFTDIKDVEMVLVPAGEFTMGSDDGDIDEQPIHRVYLDAFYIDKYEVTNALYKVCVDAGVCQPPTDKASQNRESYYGNLDFDNYPVINVWGQQVATYCSWRNARLPTEAEWEYAARGGLEGNIYPWGNTSPVCTPGAINGANFQSCNYNDTTEVGTFAPNGYGLYDMAGNVWEQVADLYSEDYYATLGRTVVNPLGPVIGDKNDSHVLRGGAWAYGTDFLRVSSREYWYIAVINVNGFRCSRSK